MTTRLTLFTTTLVQDSALSVSGLDRESSADQPFAIVDGVPTLAGRGLKGAAVAMSRRFFHPLPRSVSEDADRRTALRRSAWEFADATPIAAGIAPRIRAGVGIRHKTGARAVGVLYDREVVPAGTRWALTFRVDWSQVESESEAVEAEGILGYVLSWHWAQGRCWLGGGAARGLGWCHLEDLRAYRFDEDAYDHWVESGRTQLPVALSEVPTVLPTRSWCFRTLDVDLAFGAYRPEPNEPAWGLDMLAVGPHDTEHAVQPTGDGTWAKPSWVAADAPTPDVLNTDRAILMDGEKPLLPGSSVRGPLRHAFSRGENAAGILVQDPHQVQGAGGPTDPGGQAFGTVAKSSCILVRDGRADGAWAAAKLHMHAEDEFSAGSYGSAKRDAVRVLRGVFPIRIVVEGPEPSVVEPLVALIDRQVALGALGHLPVGGHKTRGAGWGRWQPKGWVVDDVNRARSWTPPAEAEPSRAAQKPNHFLESPGHTSTWVRAGNGSLDLAPLTLGEAARRAQIALGDHALVAWWCDPTIDLALIEPPSTFGRQWPLDENVQVDEVAFYSERAVWRAARTVSGARWVLIEEVASNEPDAKQAAVVYTPARLHGSARFSAAKTGQSNVLLREWHVGDEVLGFTITKEDR
jgi:CRISPR/Cas system CSM-associated protein Csm3 (group 7 of RAMP superfamily)